MDKAGSVSVRSSIAASEGEKKQQQEQQFQQQVQQQFPQQFPQQQQLQHQQLGKLQMLPFNPALPAFVLVVESTTIQEFPRRGGGGAKAGDTGSTSRDASAASSTSTSSIGEDPENVDDGNEVESPLRDTSGPLERMETLESSLPLKRGLSQFFDGKSRSFTSLQEVSSAAQLPKPEYPFKRRKMVLHSQMRSRAKSSSNLRKMMGSGAGSGGGGGSGGDAWTAPTFVSVSSFLPRSFSLSNVVQQNV